MNWASLAVRSLAALGLLLATSGLALAEVVVLKNGLTLTGKVGRISSLGENPLAPRATGGEIKNELVVFVDDELRRTFFSTYQIQEVRPGETTPAERISLSQRVATSGFRVAGVGNTLRSTPFDEWGRRILTFSTPEGAVDVVQGITEITPVYCRVEGLVGRKPYVWDMRLATSSLPRDTLSRILRKQVDSKSSDDRLRIVRLYIQSERYQDARAELEEVIADFPQLAELQAQVQALRQLGAKRLLREIKLRREAGQHRLAFSMLSQFPAEGVAGETLQEVREQLSEYARARAEGEKVLALLEEHVKAMEPGANRENFEKVKQEIAAELNVTTIDRLADYVRLADAERLGPEQKLALAASGWLLGSGAATENSAVAVSLYKVRNLVRQYLTSTRQGERENLLAELASLEGTAPKYLASLLLNMRPPYDLPEAEAKTPGLYKLKVSVLGGEEIEYLVQVPPEYDPYRRYPTLITLHGAATTPALQIDWWAGPWIESLTQRAGQASRHGYIVIAPAWTREHQARYEYSAREHAAVTSTLRDACRRFAIDTDRVFLSGHSMGGDAVWDIALAHPDLWAGVIPVGATADKYVAHYNQNARYVSFYFVTGELDGDRMAKNATDLNRYLSRTGYNTVVAEYRGRGHEHFQDEIQRLFEWMPRHTRNFQQADFACSAMRSWDNFYWWLEVNDIPERAITPPAAWPPERPTGFNTEGKIMLKNRLVVKTAARRGTLWLTPDMVNFAEPVFLSVNGRATSRSYTPDSTTLLEDVRTRGDRQHPFWVKVDF